MWDFELTAGDKSGAIKLPDWAACKERAIKALERFVTHAGEREMCIARIMESDADRVGFFVMSSKLIGGPGWRIACQAELGGDWKPVRAPLVPDTTTVVEDEDEHTLPGDSGA